MPDPPSFSGAVHSRFTDRPMTGMTRGLLGFPALYKPETIADAQL